ncbi:MAG TPA: hypothetical protein PLP33_24940 [Leptospiraceae bacterium]|nr:hypothetical protein [Leptospiraceae bacterium]
MRKITNIKDFPKEEHFAVIRFTTVFQSDGYGTNPVPSTEYIPFTNEEQLKDWIINNRGETFKIISTKPLNFKLEAVVTVQLA